MVIIILAAGCAAGFIFWKKYYSVNGPKVFQINPASQNNTNGTNNQPAASQNNSPDFSASNSIPVEPAIEPSDCDNECSRFTSQSDLNYCRQICNIPLSNQPDSNQNSVSQPASGDCQSKTGLDKDYCLRDQAIANKNFDDCDQIADAGIKKTCQDRITQDILEQQQNSGTSP